MRKAHLKRIISPLQLLGAILGCRWRSLYVGGMDPGGNAVNLNSSGAGQEHQIGSLPSGFKVPSSVVMDQDRVPHLKLVGHFGGPWLVSFLELLPGVFSDKFKGL